MNDHEARIRRLERDILRHERTIEQLRTLIGRLLAIVAAIKEGGA